MIMYTTLEYLDEWIQKRKPKNKIKHLLSELKIFIIMFVISFVWMLLFTNAELFFGWREASPTVDWKKDNIQTDNEITNIVQNTQNQKEYLDDLMRMYHSDSTIEKKTTISTEQDLNGGATLFLTTLIFVTFPIIFVPSLMASPRRISRRTDE